MELSEEGEEIKAWTKQDYLDLLEKDRTAGITQLSQLLYDTKYWEFERELEEGEEGIQDDTHMVEEYFMDQDDVKRAQYVLKQNDEAALFKIGFTIPEIEKILEEANE